MWQIWPSFCPPAVFCHKSEGADGGKLELELKTDALGTPRPLALQCRYGHHGWGYPGSAAAWYGHAPH